MNPNYNPQTAKAAEQALENQTQATVDRINQEREQKIPQNATARTARLEGALSAVENARQTRPILTRKLLVQEVDENDGYGVAVLAAADGDPISLDVKITDENREFLTEGAEFYVDITPVRAESTQKSSQSGFGGENQPTGSSALPGVPPITGQTGPFATTPAEIRSLPADGEPVNPEDPNATGPSSDKQQPVKGEIVEGVQTGGDSGKGTSDQTREDSQFERHQGKKSKE